MLKYSVIFVFLGLVGKSLSAPDWSQAARVKRGESGVNPTCQVPSKISADDSIVKTIVDFHNEKRREEKASNMAELIWDETLAGLAQEWAEQCIWGHGMKYHACIGDVGQNVHTGYGGYREGAIAALNGWFGERADYNHESTTNPLCLHYTQMVWHDTYAIGCGYHTCPILNTFEEKPKKNALLIVCDYHRKGNWEHEKPFVKVASEKTCIDCAKLFDGVSSGVKCSDGLCARCDPDIDSSCEIINPPTTTTAAIDVTDEPCADIIQYAGLCAHYSTGDNNKCEDPTFYSGFMQLNCKKSCGLC